AHKRFPDRRPAAEALGAAAPLGSGETGTETFLRAGRMMARRGHGGIVFLDLVDRSGRIQLVVEHPAVRGAVDELDLGDVIGVTGRPMRTRRGEPSLAVDALEPLPKLPSPP